MRWRSPAVALAAGAVLVALFAIATALQIRAVVLDEAVYKFAAAGYADGPLSAVIDDPTSRGIARLYSLVITPLFVLFDGDVAVRLARGLNCLFFAASALPVFLLARRVVRSQWLCVGAALLAVSVPWLTLGTILFSESLAYLLFAFAVWAMARCAETPSWRWDLLVVALLVALVFCRVQFVVLLPAWFAFVCWYEQRGGTLRDAWRRYPFTFGGIALAVVGVLGVLVLGSLTNRLDALGGPYAALRDRDDFNGNFGLALLYEVGMLSLGVGVVPAVLAALWSRAALRHRAGEEAFRLAVLGVVLVGALFAATLWAQGGWLDLRSEERYFIYAVPLLWVGAAAAL